MKNLKSSGLNPPCGSNHFRQSTTFEEKAGFLVPKNRTPLSMGRQREAHVKRFRGGLVFKAHRRCVLLNSRRESNKEGLEVVGVEPSLPPACQMTSHFTEMCSGSEAGSYLRLIDSCITQLKVHEPSRTCNEGKEEEEAT